MKSDNLIINNSMDFITQKASTDQVYDEEVSFIIEVNKMITVIKKFSCLALGAKFIYENDTKKQLWVKISHDKVAKWDFNQQDTSWLAQPVCSFNDTGEDEEVLHYVEEYCSNTSSLGPGPNVY